LGYLGLSRRWLIWAKRQLFCFNLIDRFCFWVLVFIFRGEDKCDWKQKRREGIDVSWERDSWKK